MGFKVWGSAQQHQRVIDCSAAARAPAPPPFARPLQLRCQQAARACGALHAARQSV
jgi:hypothetical protein